MARSIGEPPPTATIPSQVAGAVGVERRLDRGLGRIRRHVEEARRVHRTGRLVEHAFVRDAAVADDQRLANAELVQRARAGSSARRGRTRSWSGRGWCSWLAALRSGDVLRWVSGRERPCRTDWRRGWDSNPRDAFDVYSLSRGAPSTTRPPLHRRRCGVCASSVNPFRGCVPAECRSHAAPEAGSQASTRSPSALDKRAEMLLVAAPARHGA